MAISSQPSQNRGRSLDLAVPALPGCPRRVARVSLLKAPPPNDDPVLSTKGKLNTMNTEYDYQTYMIQQDIGTGNALLNTMNPR